MQSSNLNSQEEKLIIKKINNSHNHSPLSDNECGTAPQAIDLSENAKAEALKYFQEGEKITTVVQTVIQKCYSDMNDTIIITTLKKKLTNFLNNKNKSCEVLDLARIVQCLKDYHEDIFWATYTEAENIEVVFFTFKSNVIKGLLFNNFF